jgi:hypothetical protein
MLPVFYMQCTRDCVVWMLSYLEPQRCAAPEALLERIVEQVGHAPSWHSCNVHQVVGMACCCLTGLTTPEALLSASLHRWEASCWQSYTVHEVVCCVHTQILGPLFEDRQSCAPGSAVMYAHILCAFNAACIDGGLALRTA